MYDGFLAIISYPHGKAWSFLSQNGKYIAPNPVDIVLLIVHFAAFFHVLQHLLYAF